MSSPGEPVDDRSYEDFDDDEIDEEDEFERSLQNCGMTIYGHCTKAGSEECDWECPFSR